MARNKVIPPMVQDDLSPMEQLLLGFIQRSGLGPTAREDFRRRAGLPGDLFDAAVAGLIVKGLLTTVYVPQKASRRERSGPSSGLLMLTMRGSDWS